MATLDQYAYNIRNIARAGQGNSDDDRLKISQIKFWIENYRAQGLFQLTDYGKEIDNQIIQDLGVVPLTEVDKADSECPPVEWGCIVKKFEAPKFVDFPKHRAITFVGKVDKAEPFIWREAQNDWFKNATQFGKIMSSVKMVGSTFYFNLIDKDYDIEWVNIRGVFEEPSKVESYTATGCTPKCYNPNVDEYPMSRALYTFVLENILSKELNWDRQSVNDELNNARKDNAMLG